MTTQTKTRSRKLNRFRLRDGVGFHYEPNPHFDSELPESDDNLRDVMFRPGEVVESPRDLTKVFPGKFDAYDDMEPRHRAMRESVEEENKAAAEKNMELSEEAENEAEENPLAAEERAQSMNYRGAHAKSVLTPTHPKTEEFRPAEKSPGNEKPFVGPVEEDEEEEKATKKTKAKAAAEDDEEVEEEDVTSAFDRAGPGGLTVVKRDGRYFVHEKGVKDPMKGAKKGFQTKKRTKDFINKQVSSEE